MRKASIRTTECADKKGIDESEFLNWVVKKELLNITGLLLDQIAILLPECYARFLDNMHEAIVQ